MFNFSTIGASSDEEGFEDVLLSEESLDGDEDEAGGVGGGTPDFILGCWSD